MSDHDERKLKLYELLDLAAVEARIAAIEGEMAEPSFWADQAKAAASSKELAHAKQLLEEWNQAETDEQLRALELRPAAPRRKIGRACWYVW